VESGKKYWYKTIYADCPVCGYEKIYRERMYTPKPKERHKRISYYYIAYHCNY